MYIYVYNGSAFYLDRAYCLEVISKLEEQVKAGHKESELLWILAMTCERAAVPPKWCDEEDRARFLRYYGLPDSTTFPSEIDMSMAERAIGYYRSAITAAGEDRFYVAFYSRQLADLLLDLDRQTEAVGVCEKALPNADETSKPGLLVTYGKALRTAGRLDKAKEVLKQVRSCDKEGNEGGPGCDTTEAETLVGLIALDESNTAEAARWLLSSCKVQECCHSTTKGFSLNLARKLLDAGEYDAVIKFCRIVLDKFTPDQEETKALLKQALDAKKAGKKS
jgi:tetratricopeptide (TPR) repeat protein